MGNWENAQDAFQMYMLFFIHTFVLNLHSIIISIVNFLMVPYGRCRDYPWGQLSFSKFISSLRQDFDVIKKLYQLYGLPYALNIWIYECESQLNFEIANERMECHPKNV